jgi:hypothetical protein
MTDEVVGSVGFEGYERDVGREFEQITKVLNR